MKIYLMQHGEALSKQEDPDRPLSDKGKADVKKMAEFLDASDLRVEKIFHSGKTRARQTAELVSAAFAGFASIEACDGIAPNDDVKAFADVIGAQPADRLVVGHLPFMAKLVSHLCIQDEDQALVAYQPGTLVCLEYSDDQWAINWMIRPELL